MLAGPRNVKPYIARRGEQYMNKEQLEHFARILQNWKRDLMVEVDRTVLHMKDEAANFPDPNDRATQEEEFSLELRTRDRERKLIRKIDEALEAHRGRLVRLLPGDRRGDRHQAPGSAAGRDPLGRSAGAARAPRKAVRRPRRPIPLSAAAAARSTAYAGPHAGYVGRFAPTPSGDLHLGSLYAAAASYLDARAHGGRWLLRIEDLDRPREVPGAADGILRTLESFGFEWDGEVVRQTRARRTLRGRARRARGARPRPSSAPAAGSCWPRRNAIPALAALAHRAPALRPRSGCGSNPREVHFVDRIQGTYRQDVAAAVGDFILRRRDRLFSYLLAVVVDDAAQGVTHIVRGADLLDNTPRQIYLQQVLGLPTPVYAHVPVLIEADGEQARQIRAQRAPRSGSRRCRSSLRSLRFSGSIRRRRSPTPASAHAWDWAMGRWDVKRLASRQTLHLDRQEHSHSMKDKADLP